MTDIDSALSVSGNLEVGENLEVDGDILTRSGLQIGSPNYKLVYLNGVNLECVTTSREPKWKNSDDYYALNNIPFTLKGGSSNPYYNVTVKILTPDEYYAQYYGTWTGSFPLKLRTNYVGVSPYIWISPRYQTEHSDYYDWTVLDRYGQETYLSWHNEDIKEFKISNFTGLAWKQLSDA
jgi:hypothetical protein